MNPPRPPSWYLAEPREAAYRALLLACLRYADTATMSLSRGRLAAPLPTWLTPHLVNIRQVSHRLGSAGSNRVAQIRFTPAVAREMAAAVGGWFDWRLPQLPEDLALQHGDTVIVGGITHERICWFEGPPEMLASVQEQTPELKVLQGPGVRGR